MVLFFNLFFIPTVLFSLSFAAPQIADNNPVYISPTGRQVPADLIHAHLRPTHLTLPTSTISAHLYEIDDSLILRASSGRSLSLSNVTGAPVRMPRHPEETFVLDGVVQDDPLPDIYIRRGDTYNVAMDHDGTVRAVWGGAYDMRRVHHSKEHSGLLLDSEGVRRAALALVREERTEMGEEGDGIPVLHHHYPKEPAAMKNGKVPSCASKTETQIVEFASVFESEFCGKLGGSQNAAIEMLLLYQKAELPFARQTCLRFAVRYIEGWCNKAKDPYKKLRNQRSRKVLDMFTKMWRKNRKDVKRGLSYFTPGFFTKDGYSGVAYLEGACDSKWNYGFAEWDSLMILAHEIGHSLGSDHVKKGLMKPSIDSDNLNIAFDRNSLKQVIKFVDNKKWASCITPGTQSSPWPSPPPPRAGSKCSAISSESLCDVKARKVATVRMFSKTEVEVSLSQYKKWEEMYAEFNVRSGSIVVAYMAVNGRDSMAAHEIKQMGNKGQWYGGYYEIGVSLDDAVLLQGDTRCCGSDKYKAHIAMWVKSGRKTRGRVVSVPYTFRCSGTGPGGQVRSCGL